MPDASTKVVYAALAGNVLVAISKFGAALLSGSSAMLTEAIHSAADTVNQLLLLVGTRRSRARPTAEHAFGHGMEIYFWTFVVAVIVLLAGGVVSLWQGVLHVLEPHPIESPLVSLGVLALSALFEGSSLAFAYREYKRQVRGRTFRGRPVGVWRFIKLSKDPNLYESLLEDAAALVGVGFATIGILATTCLHLAWADGAASVSIGLLLIADSLVIAEATRSLVAGESVSPTVLAGIRRVLREDADALPGVSDIKTLHLGPRTILVALTIAKGRPARAVDLAAALHTIEARVRATDSRVRFVYFGFD